MSGWKPDDWAAGLLRDLGFNSVKEAAEYVQNLGDEDDEHFPLALHRIRRGVRVR